VADEAQSAAFVVLRLITPLPPFVRRRSSTHLHLQSPAVGTRRRSIFTSSATVTAASGSDAGAGGGSAAPASPSLEVTRTVWVKKAGDKDFVEVRSTAVNVNGLKKDIVAALPSLKGVDLSTLTLRVVQVDSEGNVISESKTPLPSIKALAGAGLDGAFLVLEVAAAAEAVGAFTCDLSSPAALLQFVYACVPADKRQQGPALLHPRVLNDRPLLSGVPIIDAYARPDVAAARSFIDADLDSSRADTVMKVAAGFTDRLQQRAAAATATERTRNPVVALQSAPGGGKSAMLDVLGLMSARSLWSERDCENAEMRAILNGSVPVTVTYNSGSDPAFDTYDADLETGLSLRILHSCFVRRVDGSAAQQFPDFAMMFPKGAVVPARTAVKACLLAAERELRKECGILLLVDEIVKLGQAPSTPLQPAPTMQLLSLLGGLLDTFTSRQLNVVCSTLDAVVVDRLRTASGRPLHWAPLPALTQEAAEKLMLRALQHPRHDAAASSVPPNSLSPAVRIAISDAAGHPRSLEHIRAAVEQLRSRNEPIRLEVLRNAVLAAPQGPASLPVAAVKAALRGVECSLEDELLGSGDSRKLHQLIAEGMFINTDTNPSYRVVPKLSMLRLLQFARNARSEPDAAELAKCINALASAEEEAAACLVPSLTGELFERFVAHWLRMMAIVRADEELTVLDLFHAGKLRPFAAAGGPLLAEFRLRGAKWLDALPRSFEDELRGGTLRNPASGLITAFGGCNPAFDVLLTAPCSIATGDAYVALAIETRSSNVGSRGKGTDLHRKLQLFNSKELPRFQQLQPAPKHLAFVYATAVRTIADVAAQQKQLAGDGVLLLSNWKLGNKRQSRQQDGGAVRSADAAMVPPAARDPPGSNNKESLATLERAFTPTLAHRAFLVLSFKSAASPGGDRPAAAACRPADH